MKTLLILATLLSLHFTTNADIYVEQGETFTWTFEPSDFSYERDRESPAFSMYTAWSIDLEFVFDPTIFKFITPVFEASTFEDNITESFITQATYSNTFGIAVIHNSSNIIWEDRQGVIQIEAIEGPFIITNIKATTIANNEYHSAAIPEPNSIALLLVGGGAFYLRRKKRIPNQKLELTVKTPDTHAEFMRTKAHF